MFSVVSQSSQKGFEIFETIDQPVDVLSFPDVTCSIILLKKETFGILILFESLLVQIMDIEDRLLGMTPSTASAPAAALSSGAR